MDNLFSIFELFGLLRIKDIVIIGTIRIRRVILKQLAVIKTSELKKDLVPWGMVYVRKHTSIEVM